MQLRQLMRQNSISQQELAYRLGLSRASIYKYLEGKAEPNIDTLKKMADIFDVSVDFLVEHPTKANISLGLFTERQQKLITAIKNLSDEQCIKLEGYIDGIQGKEFTPVKWNEDL